MPYQVAGIDTFEGLNQDEDPTSVRREELIVAKNVYRRGNLVGTRPGFQALASGSDYENAVDEGNTIRGAIEYRKNFDEGRRLLVIADHTTGTKVFYDDGNQLPSSAAPTINADQDYIYSMTVHNGILYGSGGPPGKSQVQTESVFTWDGDVGNDITALTLTDKGTTGPLRPKFMKSWRNYLLMSGLQMSAANKSNSHNPATVRYAQFGSDPSDDASWPDSLTIGFNATRIGLDTENYSTGFGTYQDNDGDFLILLSNRELAAVQLDITNDFAVTDTISNGCVHERAFVPLGLDSGDAIYVSERGVHSLRQSQQFGGKEDKFLSHKIRPFFKTINRLKIHHTVGAYHAESGFVLFAFSTGSSSTHNAIMCLDVKDRETLTGETARWYGPWTLSGITLNHMAYMRDTNDAFKMYLFTTDGKVLEMNESVHRDLTSGSYPVKMQSAHDPVGNLLFDKQVGDSMIEVASQQGGFSINQRTVFDFGRVSSSSIPVQMPVSTSSVVGSANVGSATVGGSFPVVSRKVYTRGRGNTISHEWSHEGDNQSFFIGRVDTQLSQAGESSGGRGA